MSQPTVVLVVLAFLAGAAADRAYLHTKLRLLIWHAGDDGQRFKRSMKTLAVVCLIGGSIAYVASGR